MERLEIAYWECRKCGNGMEIKQETINEIMERRVRGDLTLAKLRIPDRCSNCNADRSNFVFISKKSTFKAICRIKWF